MLPLIKSLLFEDAGLMITADKKYRRQASSFIIQNFLSQGDLGIGEWRNIGSGRNKNRDHSPPK
ncbi:MAG: hypothetical protein GX363_02830 [Clostridiales bacterium]|jgi:hypothetical protein|nr:hypothetical protein [Clostridiales bacterium]